MAADRSGIRASPAYAALNTQARRCLDIIERTIGDRDAATITYFDFQEHGCSSNALSVALRSLGYLGLVDRRPGKAGTYALSTRWMSIASEAEARRLAALAREVRV